MPRLKELNAQFVEFLTKYYSDNSNDTLAAHLTIIANADPAECKKKITVRTVRYYARKLGLKKSSEFQHSNKQGCSIAYRMKHVGDNFTFYSGRPSDDVRKIEPDKDHLIICASRKQMHCIKNAVYRYNIKASGKSGIHIKAVYDTDKLSVLLMPETISQPETYRTRSSQSAVQCAPP